MFICLANIFPKKSNFDILLTFDTKSTKQEQIKLYRPG